MNKYDLQAEREWIERISERNERARRIHWIRKNKVPRDDDHERTLLLMVVILALVPFAVGFIVWIAR